MSKFSIFAILVVFSLSTSLSADPFRKLTKDVGEKIQKTKEDAAEKIEEIKDTEEYNDLRKAGKDLEAHVNKTFKEINETVNQTYKKNEAPVRDSIKKFFGEDKGDRSQLSVEQKKALGQAVFLKLDLDKFDSEAEQGKLSIERFAKQLEDELRAVKLSQEDAIYVADAQGNTVLHVFAVKAYRSELEERKRMLSEELGEGSDQKSILESNVYALNIQIVAFLCQTTEMLVTKNLEGKTAFDLTNKTKSGPIGVARFMKETYEAAKVAKPIN